MMHTLRSDDYSRVADHPEGGQTSQYKRVYQDLSNDVLLTSLEELDLAPEEKSFSDSDEHWLDGI